MGFDSETSRILSHHSTNSAKKEITNNEVSRGGHAPTTVPTTIGSGAFPLYPLPQETSYVDDDISNSHNPASLLVLTLVGYMVNIVMSKCHSRPRKESNACLTQ